MATIGRYDCFAAMEYFDKPELSAIRISYFNVAYVLYADEYHQHADDIKMYMLNGKENSRRLAMKIEVKRHCAGVDWKEGFCCSYLPAALRPQARS